MGRMADGTITSVEELKQHIGQETRVGAWHMVTQDEINAFADATGDHQWIHVDSERAKAGPFGGTIAYGYLTLSLATVFLDEVLSVEGAGLVLNYGSNRVRYPAPVPVGSRVRAVVELAAADKIAGGLQTTFRLTFEVEDSAKPGCVADIVYRYYEEFPGTPTAKGTS